MKVTKAMINAAEEKHYQTEDSATLTRLHALKYIYYRQRNEDKIAKEFLTGNDVKREVRRLVDKKEESKNTFLKKIIRIKSIARQNGGKLGKGIYDAESKINDIIRKMPR